MRNRALLLAIIATAGTPAGACDITRWPSTARLGQLPVAPAHTAVAARYALRAATDAGVLASLAADLAVALDDDDATASLTEGGASLIVWSARLPRDWSAVDAAVAARARGARRTEIAVAVCLPVGPRGEIAPHVRRAVLKLPELKELPVTFEEGAARIRYTGSRVPVPSLGMRLHLAAVMAVFS